MSSENWAMQSKHNEMKSSTIIQLRYGSSSTQRAQRSTIIDERDVFTQCNHIRKSISGLSVWTLELKATKNIQQFMIHFLDFSLYFSMLWCWTSTGKNKRGRKKNEEKEKEKKRKKKEKRGKILTNAYFWVSQRQHTEKQIDATDAL